MNLSLSDKTALICGSTQGIGLATAIELAALGANCILLARNETALNEAIKLLPANTNQQHIILVADFSKPSEVKSVIEKFMKDHSVDILINNTGGPAGGPIVDAKEE